MDDCNYEAKSMTELPSLFKANMDKLGPFYSKIAVAVSGGSDSLALLHLAKKSGHGIIALTVDHDLRQSSAHEAMTVKELCDELKIEHHILKWEHNGISSNIQAKAREARLGLMAKFCCKHKLMHLLTGHHLDDRIEHFFLRLSKSSGSLGLSDSNISYHNNIQIIKPLSSFEKEDLITYLEQNNIKWIEDESNQSDKYLRNEIRHKLTDFLDLKNLPKDLFKQRIISSLDNINSEAQLLQQLYSQKLAEICEVNHMGFATIHYEQFRSAAQPIQYFILSHLLALISGQTDFPRNDSIILMLNNLTIKKHTLHGCCVEYKQGHIYIYRELGKYHQGKKAITNNIIWDERFKVKCNFDQDLYIDYPTPREVAKIYKKYDIKLPKFIFNVIPIVRNLEKLLAIPHIDYYDENNLEIKNNVQINFMPKLCSKITHYQN